MIPQVCTKARHHPQSPRLNPKFRALCSPFSQSDFLFIRRLARTDFVRISKCEASLTLGGLWVAMSGARGIKEGLGGARYACIGCGLIQVLVPENWLLSSELLTHSPSYTCPRNSWQFSSDSSLLFQWTPVVVPYLAGNRIGLQFAPEVKGNNLLFRAKVQRRKGLGRKNKERRCTVIITRVTEKQQSSID